MIGTQLQSPISLFTYIGLTRPLAVSTSECDIAKVNIRMKRSDKNQYACLRLSVYSTWAED